MPAAIRHSVTGLLAWDASEAEQRALLTAIARACPGIRFHDVVRTDAGEQVVALASTDRGEAHLEAVARRTAPAAGTSITGARRDHLDLFEDGADVILPGWDPERHAAAIEIRGQPRTLGGLDALAEALEEAIADIEDAGDDDDEERLELLRTLRDAVEVAGAQRLPVVVHW